MVGTLSSLFAPYFDILKKECILQQIRDWAKDYIKQEQIILSHHIHTNW